MKTPTRTAFFISGSGTTMEAVVTECREGKLEGIEPVVVISNKSDAGGAHRAEALQVPFETVSRSGKKHSEFGRELLDVCKKYRVDLVSQNGWLPLTPENLIQEYEGRIINQHPAPLDPGGGGDFGGTGMYGARALCARLLFEWIANPDNPWTEATVHLVTEKFDEGELIASRRVALPKPDRAIDLDKIEESKEIQQYVINAVNDFYPTFYPHEYENVIAALAKFAWGQKPTGFRRKEPLVAESQKDLLSQCKQTAISLFL